MSHLLLEMLQGAALVAAIAIGWVAVNEAWRRAFPGALPTDEDVMAGRTKCHDCDQAEDCEIAGANAPHKH